MREDSVSEAAEDYHYFYRIKDAKLKLEVMSYSNGALEGRKLMFIDQCSI